MSFFRGFHADPPQNVLEGFYRIAPEAVEVEWHIDENTFEAIYRENGIEKISFFLENGEWLETKTNLRLEMIPAFIKAELEKNWEIMNAIELKTPQKREFEFITRDKSKSRYLLFTDEDGRITQQYDFNEESIL